MAFEERKFEADPSHNLTQQIVEMVALVNQTIQNFEEKTGSTSAAVFENQNGILEIAGEIKQKISQFSGATNTMSEVQDTLKSIQDTCASIDRETDERRIKSRIALIKSDFIKLNSLIK